MLLAASCGKNAPNSSALDDEQFFSLLTEIFYKLPESVMPDYLKTDAQRREVRLERYNNRLGVENLEGEIYEQWYMAGYLTKDNRNVVLMVMYGGGMDGFSVMDMDKTLNYNIKTGELKEIKRPMDPFTADELIDESHFDNPELAAKAKAYYNNHKNSLFYQDFSKDGFELSVSLDKFYADEIEDYSDDYEGGLNHVKVSRKWNGSRFVK